MKIEDALKHLGATRVIWIDDHFNESPERLGNMLIENLEAALLCNFLELHQHLERYEFAQEDTRVSIIEKLKGWSQERRDHIRDTLLASEQGVEGAPVPEMRVDAIRTACELLAVASNDRWTFEAVEEKVKAAVAEYPDGDDEVSYIVDIKDSLSEGDDNKRGIDVLRVLAAERSRSTAFVLTHEIETAKEAGYEEMLVGELDGGGVAPFPFCVVSKQRLLGDPPGSSDVEEAFRVAIKRAGLRRSVHEVLRLAEPVVIESFVAAKRNLLRIPPEVLDEHVVRRGYEEGESELHVIERALTAHIARDVRLLFGKDERVRASNERVRSLRDIKLRSGGGLPNDDLVDFRNAETWENEFLINRAFSPLACGDVFEVDAFEPNAKAGKGRRFVLLGQPCDVQLRHKGDRVARTAVLAPLRYKGADSRGQSAPADKIKECVLQCTLDGKTIVCDLRNAASVNLTILDLATFRPDGRVRYDKGQDEPVALLPGQRHIYRDRISWLVEVIADFEAAGSNAAQSAPSGGAASGAITGGTATDGAAVTEAPEAGHKSGVPDEAPSDGTEDGPAVI